MLAAVQTAATERDILIATTGYTGRELFALGDRPNQLYMVGSMGCAISLALGLAIARPGHRVIALDGDGAALMRLGAMTTAGFERPPNLLHILIDNGLHESTGGQATVSPGVDFCAIAAASGYPSVAATADPAALGAMIAKRAAGLAFVHAPILPGVPAVLPRPAMTPAEVALRLRTGLMG
jgi:phosphonopyruvate decarboxylase